jgi:hypothetical protein
MRAKQTQPTGPRAKGLRVTPNPPCTGTSFSFFNPPHRGRVSADYLAPGTLVGRVALGGTRDRRGRLQVTAALVPLHAKQSGGHYRNARFD